MPLIRERFKSISGRLLAEKQEPYHPEIVTVIKANPHPMFGKDPNIIDAYGRTEYPKWVNGKVVHKP